MRCHPMAHQPESLEQLAARPQAMGLCTQLLARHVLRHGLYGHPPDETVDETAARADVSHDRFAV